MTNGLLIQGKNVHVYKFIDITPFEIVCGTDVVVEINQELIGATTPDSGRFREIRPRMLDMSCTISGITTSDNDGDLSYFHFIDTANIGSVQDLQIVYTDNNGSNRTIRANFYIETTNINGPAEGSSGYEIKLKSWGDYAVDILVDPTASGESVKSDSYTVASGKVSDSEWIGLSAGNIIGVWREGTELTSMGLSYTANFTLGTITPDAGTTIDGQKVFVIWTF